MAIQKIEKLIVGPGDITDNQNAASYYAGQDAPPGSLGMNGDIYVRVGMNADVYQKKDNIWTSISQIPVQTVVLPTDTTTPWLSVPITLFKGVFIDYILTRDSIVQQGKVECINNSVDTSQILDYAINIIGGASIGVQFSADLDSGQMRCLATVDASGNQPTIKYIFRGWI